MYQFHVSFSHRHTAAALSILNKYHFEHSKVYVAPVPPTVILQAIVSQNPHCIKLTKYWTNCNLCINTSWIFHLPSVISAVVFSPSNHQYTSNCWAVLHLRNKTSPCVVYYMLVFYDHPSLKMRNNYTVLIFSTVNWMISVDIDSALCPLLYVVDCYIVYFENAVVIFLQWFPPHVNWWSYFEVFVTLYPTPLCHSPPSTNLTWICHMNMMVWSPLFQL